MPAPTQAGGPSIAARAAAALGAVPEEDDGLGDFWEAEDAGPKVSAYSLGPAPERMQDRLIPTWPAWIELAHSEDGNYVLSHRGRIYAAVELNTDELVRLAFSPPA